MSKEITSNGTFFDDLDMSMFGQEFMSSDNVQVVKEEDVRKPVIEDDDDDIIVPVPDDKKKQNLPDNVKDERTTNVEEDETEEEEVEEVEEEIEEIEEKTEETEEEEVEEINEGEAAFMEYMVKDKLGNIFEDYEEDEQPKTVDELVEFFEQTAEEMSKPQYPSDEMAELHDFVNNGGDLRNYFNLKYGEVDLDSINLETESSQKAVVSEYLKEKGYSEKRIERTLNRFEDGGILEEEAEDALEELKEIRESNAKELLKQQEVAKKQAEEQQQKFLTDVKSSIENIDNVRGIPLAKKEKAKLMEYIFKPTNDGQTQYQKDYNSKFQENLIESAYFTMNKDSFVKKVQKNVSTDVKKDMMKKIRNTGGRKIKGKSTQADNRKVDLFQSVFSALG